MSETKRAYFTYMVRCADGTLYTGFTVDDVHRRIAMHNAGKAPNIRKAAARWSLCGIMNGRANTRQEAPSII